MNHRSRIVLISLGISFFGMSLDTFAQSSNPLRSTTNRGSAVGVTEPPAIGQQNNAWIEAARAGMTPEVYEAAFPSQPEKTTVLPASAQPSSQTLGQTTIVDSNVQAAVHMAEPERDLTPLDHLLGSLIKPSTPAAPTAHKTSINDIIQRLNSTPDPNEKQASDRVVSTGVNEISKQETVGPATSAKFDQERFQRLLKQLATNTFLVMVIGVGFILVAKRWVKGSKPAKRNDDLTIEIKSTLKLSPKSSLYLVQAGEQRLIVANDQNGIKTVVPLTESFANTLESITEIANDLDLNPEPKTNQTPGVSVSYSDSLLAMARKAADTTRSNDVTTERDVVPDADDEVRRKMEAALERPRAQGIDSPKNAVTRLDEIHGTEAEHGLLLFAGTA